MQSEGLPARLSEWLDLWRAMAGSGVEAELAVVEGEGGGGAGEAASCM